MKLKDKTFKFITEDGVFDITYAEYCKNSSLNAKIRDKRRFNLNLGPTIISYDRRYLKENKDAKKLADALKRQFDSCPMKFFMPSGDTVTEFINDTDHSLTGIISGNRGGKTTSAFIRAAIRMIPCDKNWDIFRNNGIEWKEFEGPKILGIASYEFVNHKTTIWPQVIRKWLPESELGEYRYGGGKIINWKDNPHLELACGSEIYFYTYDQDQGVFESQAVDIWIWDEQGVEAKFDGANERTRTKDGIHIFSLTPHKVDGRPDTGSGSWVNKLVKKEITKGHKIKFYTFNLIEDVPDWVFPEKQKEAAYKQHIEEPTRLNDIKRLRHGRSRLFGEWEESSGLVYDDWNRQYHIIDPIPIEKGWTKYRSIDHGTRNPTACIYAAVTPNNDIILYDEYYTINNAISQNVKGIVEKSGNKLKKIDNIFNNQAGFYHDVFEEVMSGTQFYKTLFDPRSFKTPDPVMGMTISQVYKNCGLNIMPASGKNTFESVPIVKEYFRIDFSREHIITKQKGAPRIYVFSTLNNFIREIEGYVNEEFVRKNNENPTERPRGKDDHLMDALRYLIMGRPVYIDGFYIEQGHGEMTKQPEIVDTRDSYTGY